MSNQHIEYSSEGGVAVITINRLQKRNAINAEMCDALNAAWRRFNDSAEERVAILTSSDDSVFTAGADLHAPPANFGHAVPEVGIRIDKPVIAAVAGPVVGGGVVLVAMCDLCVAAENAAFLYPEAKVGFTGGVIACLAARMPHKVAMELMLLGERFTAERAYQVGFVNRLVPVGQQLAVARELADTLAGAAPLVLAALKQLVRDTLPRSPLERAHDTRRLIDAVMRSEDAKEGVAAFREKRRPSFRGR